jgi:hypothetical protein
MRIYVLVILVICFHGSLSQVKIGIKAYQNTDIFNLTYYTDAGFSQSLESVSNKVNFNRFSLALQIATKNKLAHEIEFMIPELSKSTDNPQFPFSYKLNTSPSAYNSITTISVRYTIFKTIYSLGGLNFDLGIGLNPYYILQESLSKVPSRFDSHLKYYGASFNITPEVKFKIRHNLHLDLSLPVKIYDLSSETFHISNPAIPINQQTISEKTKSTFFDKVYTVRFGMLYFFNK